tara:strand:- start:14887 stop:15033 length:147 start_codon:yes stop_codon:yes gene_type:complete
MKILNMAVDNMPQTLIILAVAVVFAYVAVDLLHFIQEVFFPNEDEDIY